MFRKKAIFYILITVLTILISAGNIFSLNFDLPKSDDRENLAFAYNTLKYGVYSKQTYGNKPEPSHYREPIFPAVLMLGMLLHPEIDLQKQNANCIIKGYSECVNILTYLKIANVIFLMSTALLAFYVIYEFTKNFLISFVGFLMVSCSGSLGSYTNAFKSEIVTAFFVLLVSYLLAKLITDKFSWTRALIYGFSLGILVLAKAVFYYFVFISCALLVAWWIVNKVGIINLFYRLLAILICSFSIILPWMIRNELVLNDFSITSRKGTVMHTRSLFNNIYPDEYIIFLISSFDRLLNKSQMRWVKNQVESLFNIEVKADHYSYNVIRRKYSGKGTGTNKRIKDMKKSGLRKEQIDHILLKEAKYNIRKDLVPHIALILPFVIKANFPEQGYGFMTGKTDNENLGIKKFGFDATNYKIYFAYINIIYIFSFWGLFIYSAVKKKWKFIFFMLPVIYYISMYATFAYIIYRYVVLIIPIVVVCTCISLRKIIVYISNSILMQRIGVI